MKRISAFILAVLFCLTWSLTVFADDIFIIEDGEDEFIANPPTVTTTRPAETTTAAPKLDDILNGESLGGYFEQFKDMFGEGIDSIVNDLGSWEGFGTATTVPETTTGLPSINGGEYVPATQSSAMTTYPTDENTNQSGNEEYTGDDDRPQQEELPSVLIVNDSEDDSWGISGSTLTLIVFIAAIVILVLVVVVVLIIMTRRTEFDSAVKNRSTLPGVDQPDSLARFIEDDATELNSDNDNDNYSNITYWDDE